MRQIINIQVGQCGNQIGSQFCQTIAEQHGIDQQGSRMKKQQNVDYPNVFFNQTKSGHYQARSILVDLEPGAIDSVMGGPYARLFKFENMICGNSSASNNWAKGYYTQGGQVIQYIVDAIRRQAESADSLEAFQIVHSIGGGTGSGLGSLIMNKITDQFPSKIKSSFTLVPSAKDSASIVQPYNSVLSINRLIQDTQQCFILDNQSLHLICQKQEKCASYRNLNKIVANAMSGVTCGIRFTGQLNSGLRKAAVNLVPFPRLHFLTLACAPYACRPDSTHGKVCSLISPILDSPSILCRADPKKGRYLTANFIFRGQASTKQLQQQVTKMSDSHCSYFVQWIRHNLSLSICNKPLKGQKLSSTMIGNTTSIQQLMKKISQQHCLLFRRKAFFHWYAAEGMDQLQFVEYQSNVNDLISEYQMYQDSCGDEGEYDYQQQAW